MINVNKPQNIKSLPQVKEANVDDFILASRKNHLKSIEETGNMRFDLLQHPEAPYHV